MASSDDEKIAQFIERQIERAKESGSNQTETVYTDLQRTDNSEKVTFNLGGAKKQEASLKKIIPASSDNPFKFPASTSGKKTDKNKDSTKAEKTKAKSALDEIMEVEERNKEKKVTKIIGYVQILL